MSGVGAVMGTGSQRPRGGIPFCGVPRIGGWNKRCEGRRALKWGKTGSPGRPVLLTLCFLLALSGCGRQQADDGYAATRDFFAMDTLMSVTCYGERCEEAAEAAETEVQRLDDLLSVGKDTSEVRRLNADGGGRLSEDADILIRMSLKLYESTGGAFDITVLPLMELWGFPSGQLHVPEQDELEEALALCGSGGLHYDEASKTLVMGEGQEIDLGGIAKGYASDRLMELFEEYGIASGWVSLGGNVQCRGVRPDGSPWRIGVRDPVHADADGRYLGVLQIQDKAMVTSGAYERYFQDEETKIIYHHIIDPHTGYPADSGLLSVTVVSESGILADGLSTACYCMGLEGAVEYWKRYGEDFDLILMTEEKEVYITEPLEKDFISTYAVHVIKRE